MAGYVVAHVVVNEDGMVDSVWTCYDSAKARVGAINDDPGRWGEPYWVVTLAMNIPGAKIIDMEAEREHRPSA